ncbi:hypothetical protein E0494_09980 [Marinilabiliaceae bacterium JC040]|nr:hypothetical protein [Marinilabiliaceae bacterium JC040]
MKYILLQLIIIVACLPSMGQDTYKRSSKDTLQNNTIVIPFAFYLKSFGVAAAVDVSTRKFIQDQAESTLVGLYSTNGTKYLYWDAKNIQVPLIKRLFIHPNVGIADYTKLDLYNGPNRKFPQEIAGNNNSSKDNFYSVKSKKIETELLFRYLLPIGFGKNTIINEITLDKGIVEKGYSRFSKGNNPIKNGRTFIDGSIFYQDQNLELPMVDLHKRYSGYSIGISNENVDFIANPSRGTKISYRHHQSLDIIKNSIPWQMEEFSFSKYFNLKSSYLRQQVLAFNVWTRNVTSYNDYHIENKQKIYHRPSPFLGASLGGRYRFRGFPEGRYNDAASILYTGEYRIITDWNPLANWSFLKMLHVNVEWIQFVAFIETGKVAERWSINNLHSNMRTDYGLGIRLFANEMVIRVDAAMSREGMQIQMFIDHAF